MANVLNDLKNLSETLQNRNITQPKTQSLLTVIQKEYKALLFLRESIIFWLNMEKKQCRFRKYNWVKVEA